MQAGKDVKIALANSLATSSLYEDLVGRWWNLASDLGLNSKQKASHLVSQYFNKLQLQLV